jgi:uncharacterized membrane protein
MSVNATTSANAAGRSPFIRLFLRGLGVLLPAIVTMWILWSIGSFLYVRVAEPINGMVRQGVMLAVPSACAAGEEPAWYKVTDQQVEQRRAREPAGLAPRSDDVLRAELRSLGLESYWRDRWHLQATGLLLATGLTYLIGLALTGILGKRLYARVERFITSLPGFKQVYPHVKQLVDLVFGERRMAFRRVVLVEFPRKGAWAVAFVSGDAMGTACEAVGGDSLTVFIPTTPTPFTGFTLTVKASEVVDLPISIDEAIRYMITGGVLMPQSQSSSGTASEFPAAPLGIPTLGAAGTASSPGSGQSRAA